MIEIKVSEISFQTTLVIVINHPGRIVLPPGVTKIFQIRKTQRIDKSDTDILDLIKDCFDQNESCQK